MIDNINGFIESLTSSKNNMLSSEGNTEVTTERWHLNNPNEMFCPKCGEIRKCYIENLINKGNLVLVLKKFHRDNERYEFKFLPYLFKSRCLQCDSETLILIYKGPEGDELAILHNTYSGCVTPNSPKEVKYYIDQAYRSRSIGAISASMAMYRSALEWLLYDQGYQNGMLGQKIKDLETAIKSKTAPKWAMEIDTDFLKAIKDIGNGAIHTNGGDIKKQSNFDKELIELVDIVFAELLDKIYEQPLRSISNLNKLKSRVMAIKE